MIGFQPKKSFDEFLNVSGHVFNCEEYVAKAFRGDEPDWVEVFELESFGEGFFGGFEDCFDFADESVFFGLGIVVFDFLNWWWQLRDLYFFFDFFFLLILRGENVFFC